MNVGKVNGDIVNKETGEIIKAKHRFTKLGTDYVCDLYNLPVIAYNLFFYISKKMNYKGQAVHIDISQCMKEFGYKNRVSIYKGINALLEKKIITKINGFYVVNDKYLTKNKI